MGNREKAFEKKIRKKSEKNQKKIRKKSEIAAVPTHVPLEALYLVVGGLIVPPKENAVCTAAILDFLKWLRPICQVVTSHKERLINWKFVSIINHH